MELTKNEAEYIIFERQEQKPFLKRIKWRFVIAAGICAIVTLMLCSIGGGNPVSYYTIQSAGELTTNGMQLAFNGEPIQPYKETGGTNWFALMMALLMCIPIVLFLKKSHVFLSSVDEKTQKAALAQWEKDGTLPPIPPKKEKK